MRGVEAWELAVVAASFLNLAVWAWFAALVLRRRRRQLDVPRYLTAAAIVGTFAASAAGAVASVSLLGIVDLWTLRLLIWACWGGLFAAGGYAAVAAIRDRTGRGRGPR